MPHSVSDAGFEYLLGRDEICDLLRSLKTKAISSPTAAEFVIHYAVTDTTPAWIDDIPDSRHPR